MEGATKKPKVLLMSYAMDNRSAKGIALYTRTLITGLLDGNYSCDFYLAHFDAVSDPLYEKGHEILMPTVRLPWGSRFISLMLFFWKYRNDPFDVVHWFHPRPYPFFWLVPAKKIIFTVHGAGDVSAPTNFVFSRSVFNFVLKHFHRYIDTIVVDSHNAEDEVIQYYGFPKEKIKIIYLGGGENYRPLDKKSSQELVSQKYGIQSPYILDVSRLVPHKNVSGLIRAYALMRTHNVERREKLVIVGSNPHNSIEESTLAESLGFSPDIQFVGFVELTHLNPVYSASELFAFPSLSEGFGLPVIEAMASGVPVVTSNTTSLPEIGGDAVITVDPLDTSALALAMNRVLSDEILREKMIQSGIQRAQNFTWQKVVSDTVELYR